ncbi:GntR family transcriptional regulator [Mycoplasma marinum]|uniref:GntR family transcriptional regulator n=1 Tax=Mycoplasma marinum TaxID=1937190 RepID=UPI003B300565
MIKDTIKHSIEEYILLKIGSEKWKKGTIIPSETSLSNKFNCSRITVRSSLKTFVSLGVLMPIKGIGYKVMGVKGKLFNSISSIYETNRNKTTDFEIEKTEKVITYIKSLIQNSWGIESAKKVKVFEKLFFNDDELVVAQVSIINNEITWGINDDDLQKSLTKSLYKNGIIPNRINQKIIFDNCIFLAKYFKELGYEENQALIEFSEISNEDDWIEFSIRVIAKNKVNFQKSSVVMIK